MNNGKVYGIAYVYEGYGIIVNKKLLKTAGFELADINSFSKLEAVAKDILKYHRAKEVDDRLMSIKKIISLIDEL